MSLKDILSTIDAEIALLEQAWSLLTGPGARGRGKKFAATPSVKRKRTMSAEGRRNIVEAQRKRWAAQKKSAK